MNDGLQSQGFVPQRFALYPDLSIDENLTLRARFYGVDPSAAKRRAADLLSRVGLDRFGARLAGQLSGGMKQKLALSAALLDRPVAAAARRADDRRRPALEARVLGDAPSAASRRADDRRVHALHGRSVVCDANRISCIAGGCWRRARGTSSFGRYPRALVEVRSSDRVAVRRA